MRTSDESSRSFMGRELLVLFYMQKVLGGICEAEKH